MTEQEDVNLDLIPTWSFEQFIVRERLMTMAMFNNAKCNGHAKRCIVDIADTVNNAVTQHVVAAVDGAIRAVHGDWSYGATFPDPLASVVIRRIVDGADEFNRFMTLDGVQHVPDVLQLRDIPAYWVVVSGSLRYWHTSRIGFMLCADGCINTTPMTTSLHDMQFTDIIAVPRKIAPKAAT